MNSNKKLIITIIAILVIICAIIITSIFALKKEEELNRDGRINYEELNPKTDTQIDNNNITNIEISSYEYMNAYNCVENYINVINYKNPLYYEIDENNQYSFVADENEISKTVYNLLSKQFIRNNSIKETETFKYVNKINISNVLTIVDMKKLYDKEQVKSFAVQYVLQNTVDYKIIQEGYLIVNIDNSNSTYSIEPVNVNSIDDIKQNGNIENIESNIDNEFNVEELNDVEIIRACINRFKRLCYSYPEIVYNNMIDNEYKNVRFGNVENFKIYLNNNASIIQAIDIRKYQPIQNGSNNRYVCLDQDGKYYILEGNTILKTSWILDTYSIDIPEFTEKYNSANNENKVSLNTNKLIEAINNNDYNYIYNKLNIAYKNNNFEDVTKLETFIKNIFYDKNVINNKQYKQEGDVYIVTMQISDKAGVEKIKDITVLMRLLEGTNYEISFQIL